MISRIFLLCFSLMTFAVGPGAWARQDAVPGSRYTPARAAALGDAFLPLGDDGAAALFYNPAAVAKIRATQAEPMNFAMYANAGFMGGAGLNSYKIYSLSSNLANLSAHPNTLQGMGVSLLPTFYTKGFALGLLMQNELVGTSDDAGNVRYRSLYQLIPAAAFGLRLAGGIVRLGYSLQWVNQAVGDISAPSGTEPLGYNQGLPQGSGFSSTFGFALTLPITYLPSLNLVGRNLLNTNYTPFTLLPVAGNSPGAPARESMTLDASLSIQPKVESGVYMNWVLAYRDITNRSQMAILGRLAAGAELSFRDSFFLRGGFGSGYPSAGLGFRMKKGEFSMSWYSVELGQSYHELRDIRYMFQFQVRAF